MNLKFILSVLLLSTSSVCAKNTWFSLASEGESEATTIAQNKVKKYSSVSESDIQQVFDYAKKNCSDVSPLVIQEGLKTYFSAKKNKWEQRAKLTERALADAAIAARAEKNLYKFEPKTNQEWEKVLSVASVDFKTLYFQQQTIREVQTILSTARQKVSNSDTSLADLVVIGEVIGKTAKILQLMNIKGQIERYNTLHTNLKKKIFSLMEIGNEDLVKTDKIQPLVVVIDPAFTPLPEDKRERIYCFESIPPHTDLLALKATTWAHGNLMVEIIKDLNPKALIHKQYLESTQESYENIRDNAAPHYSNKNIITSPVVFSLSVLPYSIANMIKCENEKYFFDKESFSVSTVNLKEFEALEKEIKEKFPDSYNSSHELETEHLKFLKAKEEGLTASLLVQSMKTLVTGPKGDQTHMLVASPANDDGPLYKKGFHRNQIALYSEEESEKHGLVALNWNFTTNSLSKESHSAGEYIEMAVAVPATYVSAKREGEELPYIGLGGHSSATAMLSAVVSHIRGQFPELSHTEVREAILKGANRNFERYDSSLHGKGMLNLKGALEVAEKIMSQKAKKED